MQQKHIAPNRSATLISEDEIQRIAQLARLKLSPEELQHISHDLGSILHYVKRLDELDTRDVAPTAHAVPLPGKLRTDTPQPGLGTEQALANAPERLSDGFGVPKAY